jgi:hypothetical protein
MMHRRRKLSQTGPLAHLMYIGHVVPDGRYWIVDVTVTAAELP